MLCDEVKFIFFFFIFNQKKKIFTEKVQEGKNWTDTPQKKR